MKASTTRKQTAKAAAGSKLARLRPLPRADWGLKHVCPDCASKYYDLKKAVITCPSCGAAPPPPRVPRSTRAPRAARPTYWRMR